MTGIPFSNAYEALGNLEEQKEKIKVKLMTKYSALLDLLEDCVQLKEDEDIQTILQNQISLLLSIQKGEKPASLNTSSNSAYTSSSSSCQSELVLKKITALEDKFEKMMHVTTSISQNSSSCCSSSVQKSSQKSYVETAAKSAAKPVLSFPISFSSSSDTVSGAALFEQKQKEQKEKNKESTKKQRLIVKIDKTAMENFDGVTLRNCINDCFSAAAFNAEIDAKDKPVVASVYKSFSQQSVVITTMATHSAEYLMQNKSIWQEQFSECLNVHSSSITFEQDEKWTKFVLHDIPLQYFNHEDGMLTLARELESFNSISFRKNPIWLTS